MEKQRSIVRGRPRQFAYSRTVFKLVPGGRCGGQGGGQGGGAVITTTMMIVAPPAIMTVALRA